MNRSALLLIVLACAANNASAASISAVPIPSIPLNNAASVFDVSHVGNGYGLGPSTILNPNPAGFQYDVRDIFGGTFQTYPPEVGATIFADQQAIGTVETVLMTLPASANLASFSLWLGEDGDGVGNRSTRRVRLLSGSTVLEDITLLDSSGTQSFLSVYGGPVVKIDGSLPAAEASRSFTLEFTQNKSAGAVSGLRVLEFQAFVPEPAMMSVALSVLLTAARRNRH